MKYMLLLFNEESPEDMSPDSMAPWIKFGEDAAKIATQAAGEALHPSSTATVVSVRDGKTITTDGPFSDTKEMLGGPWLVARAGTRAWVVPPLLVVSYWTLVHQAPPTNNQGPTTD